MPAPAQPGSKAAAPAVVSVAGAGAGPSAADHLQQSTTSLLSTATSTASAGGVTTAAAPTPWPLRLPCPPVFDGDFWVDEAIRLANWLRRRAHPEHFGGHGRTPQQLCTNLLKALLKHPSSGPFRVPVDPEVHYAPNYFNVIKRPMDLGTALGKLRSGAYATLKEMRDDVELVFENAMIYNPPLHKVHKTAVTLRTVFHQDLAAVVARCLGQPPPPSLACPSSASVLSRDTCATSVVSERTEAEQAAAGAEEHTASLIDSLAQAHAPLDDAVLGRIRLTEPLEAIAAWWARERHGGQQTGAHAKAAAKGMVLGHGHGHGAPVGHGHGHGQAAGAEEDHYASLEQESMVGEGSTASGFTSADGMKALLGVNPRQLVTALTNAVDRLKADLLVLTLHGDGEEEEGDDEPREGAGDPHAAARRRAEALGSESAREHALAALDAAEFGDPNDPVSGGEGGLFRPRAALCVCVSVCVYASRVCPEGAWERGDSRVVASRPAVPHHRTATCPTAWWTRARRSWRCASTGITSSTRCGAPSTRRPWCSTTCSTPRCPRCASRAATARATSRPASCAGTAPNAPRSTSACLATRRRLTRSTGPR
jgi:hypothetical protein